MTPDVLVGIIFGVIASIFAAAGIWATIKYRSAATSDDSTGMAIIEFFAEACTDALRVGW